MTVNIKQLVPPTVAAVVPPLYMTREDRRDGTRPGAIPQPVLRFTDLISGPDTGLNDGLGSGVIVTIWGQGFGETQGQVFFTDSLGVEREAAHVYYWKKADGTLPSGPADLWRSHLMYEVAFSIPAGSASGAGTIRIRKPNSGDYSVNTLPFTVRAGRILWVAPDGDNANAGTFANPKQYIDAGNIGSSGLGNYLLAGDTVYSRGVIENSTLVQKSYSMYIRGAAGTSTEQIHIVTYPNTRAGINAWQQGFHTYLCEGVCLSKYKITTGSVATPPLGTVVGDPVHNVCIATCKNGRFVGNEMSDRDGFCSTGQAGAIFGNGEKCHAIEVFGNHIHDIGCAGTSHFQHTTYFSVRANLTVNAWKFKWNHLRNCNAKYGYHSYDEPNQFGENSNVIGTLECIQNVFVNQKGAAISITPWANATGPDWSCSAIVLDNIMINCGLGPVAETGNGTSAEVMKLGGSWTPENLIIEGNLIYKYSDESSRQYDTAAAISLDFNNILSNFVVNKNIIVSDGNFEVVQSVSGNASVPTSAANNAFISLSAVNTKSLPSGWVNNIQNQDLLMSLFDSLLDVQTASPLVVDGITFLRTHDFYGRLRQCTVGPVEAL